MTDPSIAPPSYELSQQGHDKKFIEKLQEFILSSKLPVQDKEEEQDMDDSKDSKEPEKQQPLFQTPVQPLRIQKRAPRGARPLPPSPADVQSRSGPAAITPIPPLREEAELKEYHVVVSPPPPFAVVGPSLDGPPYEASIHHVSVSAAPPFSNPNRTSFNSSPVRRGQQRPSSSYSPAQPHADSYRRISHNPYLESSNSSSPQNNSSVTRLRFDPSVAYANSMHDLWEHPSASTSVNATSLYSSAVSSHLHPASAINPGSRSSYIGARSRYSTPPRPSSSASEIPASGPVAPSLQFHSPYAPEFSASHPTLSQSARPRLSQASGHVRWATSEAEFTHDIYP